MIARCSKRSCLVAAGAEPGTGNLSPRVDDCKPLSMLFASSGRSLSPGTLPSWVLPLLRSPGEPWSGPFQMIVGRRCGCPRRRQRSLVCSSEPWLGMSGPGLRSVSCGNGPPSVAFVVLCTSSASRACAGAGVMVAKLVALVRRCGQRGGQELGQLDHPVNLCGPRQCGPRQDSHLRSQLWRGILFVTTTW